MTPKIKILFDKERDLKNIWDNCNSKMSYGQKEIKGVSENIIKICQGKKYETCKPELEKVMKSTYKSPFIPLTIDSLTKGWVKVSKEYFKRLEKITGRKFQEREVIAYITTTGRCPYSPNQKIPYFFVNFFSNLPHSMKTMGHELMHIHLHNTDWWDKVKSEIGYDKTHDLKEALTEILNLEFRDLWLVKDEGYPNHQQLRRYIAERWKKNKYFNKLTKECIVWIKKRGVK